MKKLFLIFSLILINVLVFSQSRNQITYLQLLQKNKLEELKSFLEIWKNDNPNDIELHIAYFNYYMNKGLINQQILGQMPNSNYSVYTKRMVKEPEASLAIESLNNALLIDPERIDIHIGKIELLKMNEKYHELLLSIENMFSRIDVNNNIWRYKNGVYLNDVGKNGEEVIVNAINNVIYSIRENDNLIDLGLQISIIENKYFPNNVIALNHLGLYLIDKKQYTEALSILKKAHIIDPLDEIVIVNIGYIYETLKEYDKALEYYRLIKNSKNADLRLYAINSIDRINSINKK